MKNKFLWLLALAVTVIFSACSDDQAEPSLDIPSQFAKVDLRPGTTSQAVTFTTNQPWSAEVSATRTDDTGWLTVSPAKGDAGKATLTISADGENFTDAVRTAHVHINTGGVRKTITVSQEPVELGIPEEIKFEAGETEKIITFDSPVSWSASVAGDTPWLVLDEEKGQAGIVTLTVTASGNFSRTERTTEIEIKFAGLPETVKVSQDAWITEMADDQPQGAVASTGFYVANEDWFGWDKGSVNYFKKSGNGYEPSYRVYRAANSNENDWLGTTTQFATIWGDYVYFCSKQGNRLVVADARSMEKKAIFPNLGGDGRTFVGVDDKKGYVSHSSGIVVFDIEKLQLGPAVAGVSGQLGNMCASAGRVFAISQSNGLYIIDTRNDILEKTVSGSYNTLTCSKDGDVWIAGAGKLIRMDPVTLETEEFDYPDGASIAGSWGAWNAGGLCAGTQNNVLYWRSGVNVVKYDIDTKTANTTLFTLGTSSYGTALAFYGAGLRVDPLTDELILTVKHNGWGDAGAYNWIYKLDADGNEINNFEVKGDNGVAAGWGGNAVDWDGKYFWFPAIPFFEDANKPQILLNQIIVKAGRQAVIDLGEKVIDYDNTAASILKSVELTGDLASATLDGDKLTVKAGSTPGSATATLTVISNGVRAEKQVRVDIEQ